MSDDLISRSRARHEFEKYFTDSDRLQHDCDSLLCMLPAVDAVPVVRCKDCMWSKEYNVVGDCWCMNPLLDCNNLLPPDAFCCYGERKDNATD